MSNDDIQVLLRVILKEELEPNFGSLLFLLDHTVHFLRGDDIINK